MNRNEREAGSHPLSAAERFPLLGTLLNLLFPPRCVACRTVGDWLCPTCLDLVLFFEPPWPCFMQELGPLRDVRSAAHLSGPLREAIHNLKYKGLRALAGTLGQIVYDCWEAEPWTVDVIVPVPLHPQRRRERGYNQSTLLARELARHAGLPVVDGTLLRVTPTQPQVGLNAAERVENVRGAFRCRDNGVSELRVLLVDDVLTTGATLRACAQALLEGGAHGVWGLTLAHD